MLLACSRRSIIFLNQLGTIRPSDPIRLKEKDKTPMDKIMLPYPENRSIVYL